jgi:hypothetical protein
MLGFVRMLHQTAADRVRHRIAEWVETQGYGSQRRLAKAVPGKFGEARNDQWISDIVKDRADVRLKDLDPLADAMGVPPGWLVRKSDRNYEELTMAESKLLRYFRALPDTVRHNFLSWLDYFFRAQEEAAKRADAERTAKTARGKKLESPRARRHVPRINGV